MSPAVAAKLYSINSLRRTQYHELITEAKKEVGVSRLKPYFRLQHGFNVNGKTYYSMGVEVQDFDKTIASTTGRRAVSRVVYIQY